MCITAVSYTSYDVLTVGGIQGNCCDLTFYQPYIVASRQETCTGGFNHCADQGDSGPADFLALAEDMPGDNTPGNHTAGGEVSQQVSPGGEGGHSTGATTELVLFVSLAILAVCAAFASAAMLHWQARGRRAQQAKAVDGAAPAARAKAVPVVSNVV